MLRKRFDETAPADWFYLASERLQATDVLWRSEGLTASGIELLQAAVERFLKGYLIAKGWRLVKTHDLDKLLSAAIAFQPEFVRFQSLADELTKDFFAQHYPGGDWTDIGRNYTTSREQVDILVALIQQELPQYFPKPPKQ